MGMMYRIDVRSKVAEDVYSYGFSHPSTKKIIATKVNNELIKTYIDWCKVRVGGNKWNYYGQYKKRPYIFKFKREEDLLAFRLTFGL